MGILEWLGLRAPAAAATEYGVVSPWADRSNLERVTWQEVFGSADDERPVTRRDALAIPAILRGRNMICGQVARIGLTALTAGKPSTVQPQVIVQPEAGRARSLTLSWTTDAMIFYGRAWWVVRERTNTQDRLSRPTRVEWVPEEAVGKDPLSDAPTVWGKPVAPADLLRLDGPHEGILWTSQTPLRQARSIARAAGRAADNPVPSVNLHQTGGEPLSKVERQDLVKAWATARRGRNGGVAFTNQFIEATAMGQTAEQLLIEGRAASSLECAQVLNLPGWAVDAPVKGSSLTYSNVQMRNRELLDLTLEPYLGALTGRLSLDDVLPRDQAVRADTQALTSPDFKDRMEGYKAAQDAGIYTAEQCQALEAGRPLEALL